MRLAIIDADTILYAIALRYQGDVFDTDPDFQAEFTEMDYEDMVVDVLATINDIIFDSGCSQARCYLTGKENFRYNFLPSYKWRRDSSKTPVALKRLKELCIERFDNFYLIQGEEADDSCTRDFSTEEFVPPLSSAKTSSIIVKVLCHIDKDLNQVEGEHFGYTHKGGAKGTYFITEYEADHNLWTQVLAGDTSDCYKGCPQVGDTPAKGGGLSRTQKILQRGLCVRPIIHTFTKGKKKGEQVIKWEEYYDAKCPIVYKVFLWYLKGYITKGGQGHVKGFDTTSGFENDVKITPMIVENQLVISAKDKEFLRKEIMIQYTTAYMLRAGEDIPTELHKIF